MCKKCGSTEFEFHRVYATDTLGFSTDAAPPPPSSSPPRRPQLRSPGSRISHVEPTSPSVYIGAPVVGSWTFHDEEALHEEEGIGTWAPVVRSWTFHAEDDPSPRSIASAGFSSPRSIAGLPSPRGIAGLSSPRSDAHAGEHASDASPGIGSWGFGRPKYHRDGVPHKQRQPGAPTQSAQFAPAHVRPNMKAKVAVEAHAPGGTTSREKVAARTSARAYLSMRTPVCARTVWMRFAYRVPFFV